MSTPRTSPVRLSDAERRRHALQLRRDGSSYDEIARTEGADGRPLYSSKQAAHRAVRTALREVNAASATELRGIELDRLEHLHRQLWPRASQAVVPIVCDECGHTVDRRPDYSAVDRLLRSMERRAALAGLDARHALDERALALVADQVDLADRAMRAGMTAVGIPKDVQTAVLAAAGAYLREHSGEDPEDFPVG